MKERGGRIGESGETKKKERKKERLRKRGKKKLKKLIERTKTGSV